jgi:hypothetical protein
MAEVRTVEIRPPSRSGESFAVAMTAAAIAVCALYSILLRRGPAAAEADASGAPRSGVVGAPRSGDSLPFQKTFQELPSDEQRIVRELMEGFAEAKRVRGETGGWPKPEALAADQIPPFAADAIDKAGYRWSLRQDRLIVNYFGTPKDRSSPDFLVLIQEPEPGPVGAEIAQPGVVPAGSLAGSPAGSDAEHQLLPNGALLHVTWWKRPAGPPLAAIVARSELERWTQIRLGTTEPIQ